MRSAASDIISIRLLIALSLNAIGSWASLIALWAHASYRYGIEPTGMSILTMAWSVPAIAASPLVLRILPRLGPKKLLLTGLAVGAISSGLLALAVTFTQLIAFASLLGLSRGLVNPVVDSAAVWASDKAHAWRANALLTASVESAMVAGPLLAAGLASLSTPRAVFVFDSASYLVAAILVRGVALALPMEPSESRPAPPPALSLTALPLLAQMMSVYIVWAGFLILEPIYVRDNLGMSEVVFSLLQALYAVGLVLTSWTLQTVDLSPRPYATLFTSACFSLSAILYIGTGWMAASAIGILGWGCASAMIVLVMRSAIQRQFTPVVAGRLLAMSRGMQSLAELAMLPIAGLLAASRLGVQWTGVVIASFPLLAALGGSVLQPGRAKRQQATEDPSDFGTTAVSEA